ncbi:kinase-like domain-containing protein [Podospora didyma]|uniref:Kinase-like domain-containing protein n=1 Tax=Podospora didyma TaxID=330526 RepID=A0AAE0U7H4_9PEZI|nr:kinase-like domain-containing protein [Podospora didyma]
MSAQVKQELDGTDFQCYELQPLSGGYANWVFRGQLTNPLPDGTHQVLIKHGEAYVSSNRSFALPTSRCVIESECLVSLRSLSPSKNEWCTFRTPNLYHFNATTNTQIQEYLPNAIDLKNYVWKYYQTNTPLAKEEQCVGIGQTMGRWLRTFHEWAASPEQVKLRSLAVENKALQRLKHSTYYVYLINLIDKFPALLENSRDDFEQVKAMSEDELKDDSALQVVHGDFWTGNVLLPDQEIDQPAHIPMFVVDWEVVSLGVRARDIGQMLAEMYMHKLFKGINAGGWLMEGFLSGYGGLDRDLAFRVIIHIGCHLIVIGGTVDDWGGSAEDVERVVDHGRDLILGAWRKDDHLFTNGLWGQMLNK